MNAKTQMFNLGSSDLNVSAIGLGCWQFSKHRGMVGKFWPYIGDDQTVEIIRVSLENGINWFDSAEAYGWGASEESVSDALKKLGVNNGEVVIATKWWPLFRFAASIKKTISRRLQALQGYKIDLYQIHQPVSFSSIAQQINNMADLVESGEIRFVGVSNFSAKQMQMAAEILEKRGISLVSNQVIYNLVNRKIETNGILKTARKLGVSIIAYSPLAQGILSGKFHTDTYRFGKKIGMRRWISSFHKRGLNKSRPVIDLLEKLSIKYNVTPAKIALNWLITYNQGKVVAIPGASSAEQAKQNATALKFRLSDQDVDALNNISKIYLT